MAAFFMEHIKGNLFNPCAVESARSATLPGRRDSREITSTRPKVGSGEHDLLVRLKALIFSKLKCSPEVPLTPTAGRGSQGPSGYNDLPVI